MKKILLFFSLIVFSTVVIHSCTEAVENPSLPDAFANYQTWNLVTEYTGARLSGATHSNNTRKIYINQPNNEPEEDGELPIGTSLVKEIDGGRAALVAMIKKNKGFNGWEYWDLNAGINLGKVNDCQSCHETATTDYVFSVDDL